MTTEEIKNLFPLKMRIIPTTKEKGTALLNGETVTDSSGNEYAMGVNDIIGVPDDTDEKIEAVKTELKAKYASSLSLDPTTYALTLKNADNEKLSEVDLISAGIITKENFLYILMTNITLIQKVELVDEDLNKLRSTTPLSVGVGNFNDEGDIQAFMLDRPFSGNNLVYKAQIPTGEIYELYINLSEGTAQMILAGNANLSTYMLKTENVTFGNKQFLNEKDLRFLEASLLSGVVPYAISGTDETYILDRIGIGSFSWYGRSKIGDKKISELHIGIDEDSGELFAEIYQVKNGGGIEIIELSGLSGTLTDEQLSKMRENPYNVVLAYTESSSVDKIYLNCMGSADADNVFVAQYTCSYHKTSLLDNDFTLRDEIQSSVFVMFDGTENHWVYSSQAADQPRVKLIKQDAYNLDDWNNDSSDVVNGKLILAIKIDASDSTPIYLTNFALHSNGTTMCPSVFGFYALGNYMVRAGFYVDQELAIVSFFQENATPIATDDTVGGILSTTSSGMANRLPVSVQSNGQAYAQRTTGTYPLSTNIQSLDTVVTLNSTDRSMLYNQMSYQYYYPVIEVSGQRFVFDKILINGSTADYVYTGAWTDGTECNLYITSDYPVTYSSNFTAKITKTTGSAPETIYLTRASTQQEVQNAYDKLYTANIYFKPDDLYSIPLSRIYDDGNRVELNFVDFSSTNSEETDTWYRTNSAGSWLFTTSVEMYVPVATTTTRGGIKSQATTISGTAYPVTVASDGTASVTVPDASLPEINISGVAQHTYGAESITNDGESFELLFAEVSSLSYASQISLNLRVVHDAYGNIKTFTVSALSRTFDNDNGSVGTLKFINPIDNSIITLTYDHADGYFFYVRSDTRIWFEIKNATLIING